MKKDFKKWHEKKRLIHGEKPRVFFHERDIWFCHIGENIGFEQDGRGEEFLRPVLVLKKFNNEVLWIVPLTKAKKRHCPPHYFVFSFRSTVVSAAILSQVRLIDSKRLKYKIGVMTASDFEILKEKIKHLLA